MIHRTVWSTRRCSLLLLCLWLQASLLLATDEKSRFSPELASNPAISKATAFVDANKEEVVKEWIRLTEIPAPSTHEEKRAAYLERQLKKIGLQDVKIDKKGNLIGVLKGSGGGPTVAFAAHMDTVFAADTPIKVKRDDKKLYAPGVGDDTQGCIGLLWAMRAMKNAKVQPQGDVITVFTVQEETGLHGARAFLEDWKGRLNMFVAIDGRVGNISYGALGINWYKFFYTSEGAHTLRSTGKPNPARAISQAITSIYTIPLPPADNPAGTVYNVGMLGGGKIFNAISEESFFTIDIRSADPNELKNNTDRAVQFAEQAAKKEGLGFRAEHVLALPAAQVPGATDSAIFKTTADVLKFLGLTPTLSIRGSSDGNVGMAMGIPTVSIGAAKGDGGHTVQESCEIQPIYDGIKQIILLASSLAGMR